MEKKKEIKKKTSTKKTSTTKKKTVAVKKPSKKSRKKAFTLIELLAVIIILGILMLVAIPSVTSYIANSRKTGYVTTSKNIVDGARNKVNAGKLEIYDTTATYYIPFKAIETETGVRSPYGEMKEGYAVVTYDENGFDYYWTCVDSTGTGIFLTSYQNLDNDKVVTGIKKISTDIAICGKENIVIFNEDGTIKDTKEAEDCINPNESYAGGASGSNNAAASGFFDFDSATGTITGIHKNVDIELLDANACANYMVNTIGWYDNESEALSYCQGNFISDVIDYFNSEDRNDLVNAHIIKINKDEDYPRNLTIPEKINGVNVVAIGSDALKNKGLTSVVLPSTLKTIEAYAFAYNDLKTVKIPKGVTTIGAGAFAETNLQKVTIPNTVTSIAGGAFKDTPFLYLVINKTNKSFDWGQVFGYSGSNNTFAAGTYTYSVSESDFLRNNYRYYYPYKLKKYVSTSDNMTIDMDKMFDYGPYRFNLKNSNGYKVYSYNGNTRAYELTSNGPMNIINGYCGKRLSNFYIEDSSGNIIYEGLYTFYIENAMC